MLGICCSSVRSETGPNTPEDVTGNLVGAVVTKAGPVPTLPVAVARLLGPSEGMMRAC
jgi:hypothetical protein